MNDNNSQIWADTEEKRKKIWKEKLFPRLDWISQYAGKKYPMKHFERFYISQKEPRFNRQTDGDKIPLILRLWWSDDHSFKNWCNIRDMVFEGEDWLYYENNLDDSGTLLGQAHGNNLGCEYDIENGFFLGDEKKLLDFYLFHVLDSEFVKSRTKTTPSGEAFGMPLSWSFRILDWLNRTINLNMLSLYRIDEWVRCSISMDEGAYTVEVTRWRGVNRNSKYLMIELMFAITHLDQYLLTQPEIIGLNARQIHHSVSHKEARESFCIELVEKLESAQLPDFINHWWQSAKNAETFDHALQLTEARFTPEPEVKLVEDASELTAEEKRKRAIERRKEKRRKLLESGAWDPPSKS